MGEVAGWGNLYVNYYMRIAYFRINRILFQNRTSIFTILLFTDFGLTGSAYVLVFAIIYLLWGISFTMNDISFWSMLPTLSQDQHEKEQIGSVARICANIGLFSVVSLIVPITEALEVWWEVFKKVIFFWQSLLL